MIEINDKMFPEHAIAVIERLQHGWMVVPENGPPERGMAFDWQIVPNTTQTRALVIFLGDGGKIERRELPVVAWRVCRLDGDVTEPILADFLASNEAFCLFDGDSYWRPGIAAYGSRDTAIAALAQSLRTRHD